MTSITEFALVIIVGLVIILGIMGLINAAAPAPDLSNVIVNEAHDKHGVDAEDVRNCKNILQIWIDSKCERFNIIKQLDDKRIGNQVVQPCKRGLLERTAYVFDYLLNPTDPVAVAGIMAAKGCTQVWP